jgi:LacI family transcriptional regulator
VQAEHLKVDAYISQAIYGLNDICNQQGFRLLIESMDDIDQAGTFSSLVRSKKIDGLVAINSRMDDKQLYALVDEGFPTVLIGSVSHPSEYAVVHRDKVAHVVKHLVSLGHRRIAHITLAPLADHSVSYDRLRRYRRVMEESGLEAGLVGYGNYSAESGFMAMSQLLAKKPYPTAVFAANDTIAVGVMSAISKKGLRIPEDIAVVGYDDIPISAYTSPPLTTVRQSAVDAGKLAAEMLIQLLRGETPKERRVKLEAELIIRESCGAKRQVIGVS